MFFLNYYYYLILFKFYLFFPEAKFTVYAEMMRNMTGHADTLVLTVSNLPYFMRWISVIKLHKSQYLVAIATVEGVKEYTALVLADDFTTIMFTPCRLSTIAIFW